MDRQEYLNSLSEQIRCKRAIPYVTKELEDHIEDQKEYFIAQGIEETEAEEMAVAEMGDPVETGVMFDLVHRPKMEWSVVVGVLIMSAIGLGVQIVLAGCYYTTNGGTIEGNFWGGYWDNYWEILNVLNIVSRQFIGMLLGIALMMVICYLDYSLLIKWSFPIWIALHVLMIGSDITGLGVWVNGRATLSIWITYLLVAIYAGMVYRYRGQARKGLVKCTALLIFSVFAMHLIPDVCTACINLLTGIVVLIFAICKKWFGNETKKLLLGWFSCVAVLGVLIYGSGVMFFHALPLPSYYLMRIDTWLHGGENFSYLINLVRETAQNVKAGNGMEQVVMEYIKNSYVWTYLFEYLGTWKSLVLLVVFGIFILRLFRLILHQKNQLGYIVGVGCITYLCIQAVLYIGNNFNIVPLGSCYMPFISNGVVPLVVTYFYMGILLSVFRNRQVVRN